MKRDESERRKNLYFRMSYFLTAVRKRFLTLDEKTVDQVIDEAIESTSPLTNIAVIQRVINRNLKEIQKAHLKETTKGKGSRIRADKSQLNSDAA